MQSCAELVEIVQQFGIPDLGAVLSCQAFEPADVVIKGDDRYGQGSAVASNASKERNRPVVHRIVRQREDAAAAMTNHVLNPARSLDPARRLRPYRRNRGRQGQLRTAVRL